jgi:hypothetical protein
MLKYTLLTLTFLFGLYQQAQSQTQLEIPVWKTLESNTDYRFNFYVPINAKRVEVYVYQTQPLPYKDSSLLYKKVHRRVKRGNLEIDVSFPYGGRFLHVVKVYQNDNPFTSSRHSVYMEQYKIIEIVKKRSNGYINGQRIIIN